MSVIDDNIKYFISKVTEASKVKALFHDVSKLLLAGQDLAS